MIGKIIPSRKDGGDPGNLIEYLIFGKGKNRDNQIERYSSCLYVNSPTQNHDDFIRDCIARKYAEDHSKDNMYHFVLSLTEKDKADDNQLFESAKLALNELGLSEHSAALIVHRDTHLPHIHIACDLVNPVTFQRVKRPSHDFSRLAKACRIAESQYGFSSAKGHHAGDRAAARELGQPEPMPPQRSSRSRKVRDHDAHQPQASFQSRIEGNHQLRKIFDDAANWQDLAARLSQFGQAEFGSPITYQKFGSGAVLMLADDEKQRGKASLVHNSLSLSKMERRFGKIPVFVNAPIGSPQSGITSKPAVTHSKPKDALYEAFLKAKEEHQGQKNDTKAKKDALKQRHRDELSALKRSQFLDRHELLRSTKDHKSRLRLDSERALKAARAKEELEIRQAEERKALYSSGRFPSWREWLQDRSKTDPIASERLQRVRKPDNAVNASDDKKSLLNDVSAHESKEGIEYRHFDKPISLDRGKSLSISDESDEAILINLRIAQSKFGSKFTIRSKSIDRYISIAAKHGIYISSLSDDQKKQWKTERETLFHRKPYPNPTKTNADDQYHHRSRMNKENQDARTRRNESNVTHQLREMHLQQNQNNNQRFHNDRSR